MKLHANMYHVDKQPSLEDGSMKYEIMDERCTSTIDQKSNRCNRLLQLMKVILYIELILFIGWIGCVFITNYYQPHKSNSTAEQHGASEWSQDPRSPDTIATLNSVSQYTARRSTNEDDLETTTVRSETQFVNKNKNVDSHAETTTATKIIESVESHEKSMEDWLNSWSKRRSNWDDISSESTSYQDKLDWDPLLDANLAFNRNIDKTLSIEKHFVATNEDDEMELNYLLTLPLWHNVIFTSDSVDKSVDLDKDSFDQSTEDHRQSLRQTRSTDDDSSSSSSSSSEESNKTRDEPNSANGESSNEDECAPIVDDDGNVTNEAKDGHDWVSLLKQADIPECGKSKVAKSVTVNRCGKIAITCVDDDDDDTPMKHHRRTRNTETQNAAEQSCKQRFALWLLNLKAWRARIVKKGSAGQMVQEVHQSIQEHLHTLIEQAIIDRTSGKPRKTEEEWHNSLISMKRNIAELMDSEHGNLLVDDNKIPSKMGAFLGEIVETAVDIRMDCQKILSPSSQSSHTMTKEQKDCLQATERMTLLENKLATTVVPGESTNPEVRALHRLIKPHAVLLILEIIQSKNTRPSDLTDEQLTSFMRGLKEKMLHFAEYTGLRTHMEEHVSPTSEETILLREMVDHYSHVNENCSMAHFDRLLVAMKPRETRAVFVDPPPSSLAVATCLDEDEEQFEEERKERFNRYNISQIVNIGTVRIRPFLEAIEERLTGATPTESPDEDEKPTYMSYIKALNVFLGNTSTELKNKGYRLLRDIVLESKYLEDNDTAAEGYDLREMMRNWTGSCLMHIDDDYTAETILMAVIKLGETLNLRYTGAEDNKTCGDEFTPVYGTFTYVGEEPQKSIVRKWRHIFGGLVTLYFDIHNPEAVPACASDQEGSESSDTAKCASKEDIAQFDQERQERFDRYNRSEERTISDSWTEPFLDAIEEKLNGVTTTENSDDEPAPLYMSYMRAFNVFAGNSSTDLKEEGYRLLRDIILELKFMEDNRPAAFEGYVMSTIMEAWTANCLKDIGDNYTAETVLIAAMKVAEGIDLHYSALDSGKKCGEQFEPTYGTFTYVGEAPEKSLVRRWRHIFNSMSKLYFKMYNPEVLPKVKCRVVSHTLKTNSGEVLRRMGKRSINHRSRKSATAAPCLDDDDAQFEEERKERFNRYNMSLIVNIGTVRIRPFLDAIEERLTGATPTENPDEDEKPTYLSYIKALNVFLGNTSTELKNRGYRLLRDIVLESKYLEDNDTAAEGYDLDEMMRNWTGSCLMHIDDDYTAETILMAVIKLGETLNLRYTGAEDNKTCGDKFTPVYGTFNYVGEEPQKSIVRKWRHIFGGLVRLYFDIHNPEALSACASDQEGSESSDIAKCASKDDIAQFDQERQERFDRYNRSEERTISDSRTEPFLDAIEERLNGVTTTENSDDKPAPPYTPYMRAFDVFVGNSSTDLKNEGYRLLRDYILELKFMDDNRPASMEGYSLDTIMEAWTANCLTDIGDNYTAETVLIAAMKVAEGIDLHYSGLDSGKKCGEQFEPTYGTFTYVGEAPEKSLVRRWRHILNAMAKLYFKIHNPEVLPKLNCKEESPTPKANTGEAVSRMGKRSIGYPSRKSDNSVDVDEKDSENYHNRRLIKVSVDLDAEPRNFDRSQDSFIDKMEMLSAHIDRLHDVYQKYNELNDDYVSKEFAHL